MLNLTHINSERLDRQLVVNLLAVPMVAWSNPVRENIFYDEYESLYQSHGYLLISLFIHLNRFWCFKFVENLYDYDQIFIYVFNVVNGRNFMYVCVTRTIITKLSLLHGENGRKLS